MKQPDIQIEIEEISPSKAAEYLKYNRSNRHLIENRVLFYQRQMEKGQWKLTGDPIKFNGSNLIDGQHRLQAIVRSGVTVRMVVVRNLDSDVFDVLDTGRTRQAGDVLSAYGYKNVFLLASAGRFLYSFERQIVPHNPHYPNTDILQTINKHRDITALAADIQAHKFARSGVIVASLYWLTQCSKTKGEAFVEAFLTGLDLKVTSPIYQLRERIINDRMLIATKRNRVIAIAMIFRTYNNWIQNKVQTRMSAVTPTIEDFPWPAGGPYILEK
jgi:hypothetical protein